MCKCRILVLCARRQPAALEPSSSETTAVMGPNNLFQGVLSIYGREFLVQREIFLDYVNSKFLRVMIIADVFGFKISKCYTGLHIDYIIS